MVFTRVCFNILLHYKQITKSSKMQTLATLHKMALLHVLQETHYSARKPNLVGAASPVRKYRSFFLHLKKWTKFPFMHTYFHLEDISEYCHISWTKESKKILTFFYKFDSLYYLISSNTLVLQLLWEWSFETFLMMYHKLLPGAFEKKKEVFYWKQTTLPTAKKVLSLSNTQRESSSSQNRNAGHTHTHRKTIVPSPLTHMHGNSSNYMYIKNPCHPYIYIPIPTSTYPI